MSWNVDWLVTAWWRADVYKICWVLSLSLFHHVELLKRHRDPLHEWMLTKREICWGFCAVSTTAKDSTPYDSLSIFSPFWCEETLGFCPFSHCYPLFHSVFIAFGVSRVIQRQERRVKTLSHKLSYWAVVRFCSPLLFVHELAFTPCACIPV